MKLFKNNQTGRSMVEMLGVLAIIGVLSVGGIAGYSKAMFKYKINKTIDEITTIFQNFRTLCFDGSDRCSSSPYAHTAVMECSLYSSGSSNKCQTMKSLKLIPDDMLDENNKPMHAFNGDVNIRLYNDVLSVAYNSLPKEVCVALATVDWGAASSGITSVSAYDEQGDSFTGYSKEYAAKKDITLTRENSLPIPVDVASMGCVDLYLNISK